MTRSARAWPALVVAAVLAGCGGGQTGQPTSAECNDARPVSADAAWGSGTLADAARGFDGEYRAPLAWVAEAWGSSSETPVDFADEVVIDLAYTGADGHRVPCQDAVAVPVVVDVHTTASGLSERATTDLAIRSDDAGSASVSFDGSALTLVADVTGVPDAPEIAGSLVPAAGGAPGGFASFSSAR